ncbi:hypothetical protein ScPMuIL_007159 [Solemya velum]
MSTSKQKKLLVPGSTGGQQSVAASTMSKKVSTYTSKQSKYGGPRTTTHASSRSNVLSSNSRKSIAPSQAGDKTAYPGRGAVQVLDDVGNDVTPLPLLPVDQNAVMKKQSNIGESSAGTPTDLMSQSSIYNTGATIYNGGTTTASTFGGGPFTRSVFSQSYDTGSDSMTDEIQEPVQDITPAWAEIRHKREEVKEELKDADLEKIVDLTLTETETIWLLDMPGTSVSTESEESTVIKERNERYAELVKSKVGNDRYAERGMNTFNDPLKLKSVQTSKITHSEVGVTATNWDMFDTYEQEEKEKKAKEAADDVEGTISRPSSPKEGDDDSPEGEKIGDSSEKAKTRDTSATVRIDSRATISSSLAGSESIFPGQALVIAAAPSGDIAYNEEKILKLDSFKTDLFTMERVINLNTYQPKQAMFRDFSIVSDIDVETPEAPVKQTMVAAVGPNFDRLWAYSCGLTKGRNVSSLSWNKLNPDLIAVGYGQFEFFNQRSGLVCCWSLKNPEFPERVYQCKEGVTAVDFSVANPNLLAAGMYDGGVAIYNVRNSEDEPVVDNFHSTGKHSAPVWHIRWIEKDRGSGEETIEVLVSISTDGRVTQWSIRKGFENYDLMRLKRVPTKMRGKKSEKKGEAFISRHAGGTCFDFHDRDSNIYLAGTEEGHIHKCSCSYNEQYLESYSGHSGPVYKIEWSPFDSDIFLSCSADWSIRLWHQDRPNPILSFFSSTKSVYDVTWSPRSSTVFACVNEGAVEVWDLNISTLDPLIINTPTSGAKQTCVTFAKNSECILVGDSEGQVTVYQLRNMPIPNQIEALDNVIKSSPVSQLQSNIPEEADSDDSENEEKIEADR